MRTCCSTRKQDQITSSKSVGETARIEVLGVRFLSVLNVITQAGVKLVELVPEGMKAEEHRPKAE
jgi:hypothetical protein